MEENDDRKKIISAINFLKEEEYKKEIEFIDLRSNEDIEKENMLVNLEFNPQTIYLKFFLNIV